MNLALFENHPATATLGKLSTPRKRVKKSGEKQSSHDRLAWKNKTHFLKSCLKKTLMTAVIAGSIYYTYLFLTESPYFSVQNIQFQGLDKVSDAELLKQVGSIKGENIFFLDLKEIANKLAERPWALSVSAARAFPNTIRFDIKQRTPFARIQLDRVYVMDNFGVLLEADSPIYKDLPLVSGNRSVKAHLGNSIATDEMILGLQTMNYFNQLPFFKNNPIVNAEFTGEKRIQFITRDTEVHLIADLGHLSEGIQKFLVVLDTMENDKKNAALFDLSYEDRVIVKMKQGLAKTAGRA